MDNDPRIRCRKGDCFMRDLLFLSDNDGGVRTNSWTIRSGWEFACTVSP